MKTNPVTSYALAVTSGKIISCKFVRLACERHLRDLKDSRFVFDGAAVEKVIRFFSMLKHYKGECAGNSFVLSDWQKFIIGSIYGWRWVTGDRKGKRRFRYSYVEVPRKNGKTTLAAGVGHYALYMDGEAGSEVYSVATKEEQAKIGWSDGAKMVKHSDGLSEIIKCKVREITYDAQDSFWRPLGSDSDTLDGLNPHCTLYDELHAWKNRQLWDVMDDATGARSQPLAFQITTAGFNQNGICYEQRKHVISLLEELYDDPAYFGIIFTVDNPDKWDDENEWLKANPNLGVSKSLDYMRDQCARSKQTPGKLNAFLNKQLNIWTEQEECWLEISAWDACTDPLDLKALVGRECFTGLDLATVKDLAAAVHVFPIDGKYHIVPRFYCPQDTVRERSLVDRVPYDLWVRQGFITATPGNVIDFDFIRADIQQHASAHRIREIPFDRWNANQITTQLTGDGLQCVAVGQGFVSMNAPSKEFEKLILSKRIVHGGNPVLRWMVRNVTASKDAAGNIKPDKAKSREKIDGVVATIMALGRAIVMEPEGNAGVLVAD